MSIISSLIGGAFSLIGQGQANRQNKAIISANNDFNAKQAQLARDWQEDQYNKYSSPSALVRQYEEAGLNPALVAGVGQGTTFSGSSASAASPIAMQNPYGNVGLEVANLIETVKNNKSLRNLQQEQAETEEAKQRNLDSDTAGKDIDNMTRDEFNRANINNINQGISESLNRIANDNKRVENEVKHINGILSQIESNNSVNSAQVREIDASISRMAHENALTDQQKVYYASYSVLLERQSVLSERQADSETSHKSLMDSQKDYYDKQGDLYSEQYWEQQFKNKYLALYGSYPSTYDIHESVGSLSNHRKNMGSIGAYDGKTIGGKKPPKK